MILEFFFIDPLMLLQESVDSSSSSEEDIDDKLPREVPDNRKEPDEMTKLLIDIDDDDDEDKIDGGDKVELFIAEDHDKPKDTKLQTKAENAHLMLPWVMGDGERSDSSFKKPGLFYIGE